MQTRTLALIVAAAIIGAGCVSNETKPETTSPTPAATQTQAPVGSKPACPPPDASKKAASKKSAKKGDAPAAPADCEPTKAKSDTASAKVVDAKPGAAAAPATGAGSVKTGSDCKPCVVKSKDGSFDGEVYGNIPANSKWARLQIGMQQSEVERILGVTSNIRGYVTAKAFIPFYFGSDSHRYEAVYAGQGSVAYTGGSWGGGQGILMMINYDAKIQ